MEKRETVVSAGGVKALAHEARWRAVELLGDMVEATATELSARIGESASAMSYHLRVLADAGFVERAPAGKGFDRRERRWRLTFDSFVLNREPDGDFSLDDLLQMVDVLAASLRRRIAATGTIRPRPSMTLSQADLRLTPDEAADFSSRLSDLIAEYSRLAEDRTGDATVAAYCVVVPLAADR